MNSLIQTILLVITLGGVFYNLIASRVIMQNELKHLKQDLDRLIEQNSKDHQALAERIDKFIAI